MAYAPSNDNPQAGQGGYRGSKRITITLNLSTYKALEDLGSKEGRSLSNLVSYLVEGALAKRTEGQSP
jgi:hypothetical protein